MIHIREIVEQVARTESEAVHREARAALIKVYGPDTSDSLPAEAERGEFGFTRETGPELVQKYDKSGSPDGYRWLTSAQKRKIRLEYLYWELSLQEGRRAFDQFQRLRPHAVLNLHQIARLFDIGMRFGYSAAG